MKIEISGIQKEVEILSAFRETEESSSAHFAEKTGKESSSTLYVTIATPPKTLHET